MARSVSVSTQVPPHSVRSPQSLLHVPAAHSSPAAHVVPQPSQLAGSELVSVQTPSQATPPDGHPQLPSTQDSPATQALAQAPQ